MVKFAFFTRSLSGPAASIYHITEHQICILLTVGCLLEPQSWKIFEHANPWAQHYFCSFTNLFAEKIIICSSAQMPQISSAQLEAKIWNSGPAGRISYAIYKMLFTLNLLISYENPYTYKCIYCFYDVCKWHATTNTNI